MSELSGSERRHFERQLREKLRQDCDECEDLGYRPNSFRGMLTDYGPVGACIRVILDRRIPDGFLKLLELNRLDLTAEAVVLHLPWRNLFESAILERARGRLREYGRQIWRSPRKETNGAG
jgi:hypothetical protein